ncbi:MAG: ATP-binding protein, partial [Myxococcota bacterium]
REIALGAFETLEDLAKENQVELEFVHAESGLDLECDPLRIKQVLINLVGNAIKFTPSGGTVKLQVARESERIRFVVADSGVGIPEEHFESIFDSFRQVDGSHTRAHGGTGLGLAIAKQLVERHHGTISVESEIGKGSTFTVELPQTPGQRVPEATPMSVETVNSEEVEILVVDDSRLHLEIARRVLGERGYRTSLLSESTEAFDRIKGSKPHVVILDVMMPHIDGYEILDQVQKDAAMDEVLVVVVSADPEHEDEAKKRGALWLSKPWNVDQLDALLTAHLSQRRETEDDGLKKVHA